jgi:hypothetical protein
MIAINGFLLFCFAFISLLLGAHSGKSYFKEQYKCVEYKAMVKEPDICSVYKLREASK